MKYTNRGLRRRNGDKWEAVFTYTDPNTGDKRATYHTVEGKTPKAARTARDELRFKLEAEGTAPSSKATVEKYVNGYIERRRKDGTVEASTICGYSTLAKMAFKYIGQRKVAEISIAAVEKMLSQMIVDGYSPCTRNKVLRFLRMVFKDAMAHDIVKKNPFEFVRPPRKPKTKINALNAEERTRMLELAHQAFGNHLSLAIELALVTGMRRSEICALRWNDIDEDSIIHVRRSLGADNGTFYIKSTKSDSSERDVPLAKPTFDLLMTRKNHLTKIANELGVDFGDPYIIAKKEISYEPYNPTMLSREFATFSQMNGFNCTFHDLRHTFATYMIAAGVDVVTVASYLGHANIAITLNTYAASDPDAKRVALSTIEQVIGYAS